jgi:glycerophosphoryl diester phosphodiesterase
MLGNKYPPLTPQQLVAHRGYQLTCPENTLLAYRQAIISGALFVETDILLSADGVPVLCHDPVLTRLAGVDVRVDEQTLEQLKTYSFGEPQRLGCQFEDEKIATLAEFVQLLQQFPQVTAYVEIKEECVESFGMEAVRCIVESLHQVQERSVVISFDYAATAFARQLGFPKVGIVLRQWQDVYLPVMQSIQPDCYFCATDMVPEHALLADAIVPMVIYEISDLEQAHYWLGRGAYQVETFNAGQLL